MNLMDLGFLKRDKLPPKNYLALRVGLGTVTAGIWGINGGKVQVDKTDSAEISSTKVEDLLVATDKVVSAVSENSPVEVKEILFGVPPDWIVDGKLDELQLTALRRICKEMAFIPLGFVSVPEAIVNYYKDIESTPLTAIIVGVDTGRLYLTLVRAGKIIGSQTVVIETDHEFGLLIEQGIKKFPESEVLPSRILIYDGVSDLSNLEAQIVAYPWTQKLPFLHFPKVESVQKDQVCAAIAFAGGSQLGATIPVVENHDEQQENVVPVAKSTIEKPKFKLNFPVIPNFFKFNLPKISFNMPKQMAIVGLVIGILVFIGVLIGAWYSIGYLTNADIVLTVSPKQIEGVNDITSEKVAIQKLETVMTGTKKMAVTGRKIVGEKAKGTVTIYSTTVGKIFPAGTVLTYKNLRFVTDTSVTVASGSAATAATVEVNVTATGIGDSYNVVTSTLFDFADYPSSSYQAKSNSAFSGGSSRSISVVAKADQEKLLNTLTEELTKQAKNSLQEKAVDGQQILDSSINIVVSKKTFDKNVDEETDGINLSLSLKIMGAAVNLNDLIALIPSIYADSIPDGYQFAIEKSTANVEGSKLDKAGNVTLKVKFNSILLPIINSGDLAKSISGISVSEAKKKLSSFENVSNVEINISPSYLSGMSVIPRNISNIKVAIITP